MENRKTGVTAGLILVLVIGFVVYSQKQNSINSLNNPYAEQSSSDGAIHATSSDESSGGQADSAGSLITLSMVAEHNSKTNCWSAINGYVYNLTSWIPNHPGGEAAIIQICGKDGSVAFSGKHGGDSRAQAVLAGFKIGILAN